MQKLTSILAALLVGAVGCGGTVANGTGGSGGASTGTTTSTGTTVECPAAEPSGGSCAGLPSGLRCTYGEAVRPECRDAWICTSGTWTVAETTCTQPPSGDCPLLQPASTATCPTQGDVCVYGSDLCVCDACAGGPCMAGPSKWLCSAPPTTAGCPAVVPNDGTACGASGVECTYGFPCAQSGTVVDCTAGVWVWNMMIACAQ